MPALRRLLVLLTAVASLAVLLSTGPLPPPAAAAGDDYPFRSDTSGSVDDWGFTRRQCVSFVAWRLEQRGVVLSNRAQGWGNAADWARTARRLGYRVGTRPVVGAVAHWKAGETSPTYPQGAREAAGTMWAGRLGHVGYVRTVHADGSATVEQYNATGDRRWSVRRVRAPRYLFLGGQTPP